jgi:hypothetical protein
MRFSIAMTDGPLKRVYTAIVDVPPTLAAAKLVQAYKARNEMEGNLLVAHLQDNGIEVAMRLPPSVPPYDAVEWMVGKNKIYSIFVREPDADHARQLIQQFSATAVDMPSLEALAAQRLPLTREKIGQLRGALREERRTFRVLAGSVAAFIAAALIWRWTLSYSPWSSIGAILAAVVAASCWIRPER